MAFVDTSFLFALARASEEHHAEAAALQQAHAGSTLVTTSHVVGECWTLINRRLGHRAAARVANAVRSSPRYEILRARPETEERAWEWLLRHDEREYSFVDAVSFAVMRERGITEAFAFDRDFEAAGFRLARP